MVLGSGDPANTDVPPKAIPQASPVSPSGIPSSGHAPTPGPNGGGGFSEPTLVLTPAGSPPSSQSETVELSFAADRNQLYAAWQALANLADLCGNVTVSVKGEAPQGLDKPKLENGVYEPLPRGQLD